MTRIQGTLILATYEMPRHLELVFAALERQSARDFEIMVCDDGSGPETRAIIDSFRERSGLHVKHLWQENKGFRKSRILNEAIRGSRGESLIFLDGDCVPHRHFVRDHLETQEAGRYLAGRRVELGRDLSEKLTPELVSKGFFDLPRLPMLVSALKGETEFLNRTIRVSVPRLRKLLKMERVADLKGCNYSVAREAMLAINGYDEAYEGYGREDTDVELRLQNLGLKIKSLKGLALQYHVWHPRRDFTPANEGLLEEVRRTGRVRCARGLVGADSR